MSYMIHHHGAYWFQIRVPRSLAHRYGQLIRQNLNTSDRALAQSLAYKLAGQWLGRFSAERANQASIGTSVPALHSEKTSPQIFPRHQPRVWKFWKEVVDFPRYRRHPAASL